MFGTAQNQQGYEGAGVGPQAHGHKQFLPGMWYIWARWIMQSHKIFENLISTKGGVGKVLGATHKD